MTRRRTSLLFNTTQSNTPSPTAPSFHLAGGSNDDDPHIVGLLRLSLDRRRTAEACRIHTHLRSTGANMPAVLSNRLIHLCSKSGNLTGAQKVFDEMPVRDSCSWNTMIAGYSSAGDVAKARRLFDKMPNRDHFSWSTLMSGYTRYGRPLEALFLYNRLQISMDKPRCDNRFTASCALTAAAVVPCLRSGREIHAHILRVFLHFDAVIWSSLCDMYAKCGKIEYARNVFDRMPDRDVVSWTGMIDRYFDNDIIGDGFDLFREMLGAGVKPNEFTFAGLLDACSRLAVEGPGRQVHGHMMRSGFNPSSFAASALVHMYSNFGSIEKARIVFNKMPNPDLVSFTSIISAHAQNGDSEEALRYFDLMLQSGIRPDHVTFVGVLSACARSRLVDRGLQVFHSIKDEYGISHTADHYACVVDLLSRAGRFDQVEEIITAMPVKPNKFLWASLLSGCKTHKNLRLGERAARALFDIEPENAATYVTLGNIYASVGMWGEVERIRKSMRETKVTKKPGSSWLEVKGMVHVFLASDKMHPLAREIYGLLKKVSIRMREEGYIPDIDSVLHDIEDEQKAEQLSYHSEKLAVAFGIIAIPDGPPVKIFKNLRICGDCHTVMKFISRVYKRDIIIRDSHRFHHFRSGICSCKDYW